MDSPLLLPKLPDTNIAEFNEGTKLPNPNISEFYKGKTVLVTGVTGFLGKVILERLLWELPMVRELRVMVRGADPTARLRREVLKSPIFDRLRRQHGEEGFETLLAAKIRAVPGDLAQEQLGLDSETYERLADGLDVILNSAALVAWGERLDRSMDSNSLGCLRILRLAQHAEAQLVHVSTAFVHGQRRGRCPEELLQPANAPEGAARGPPVASGSGQSHVASLTFMEAEIQACRAFVANAEERSRAAALQGRFAQEAALRGSGATAEQMQQRWVNQQVADWGLKRAKQQGWWDSYTYSKAIGEMFLNHERGQCPVAVVRPTGITSCLRDPESGWIDAYLLVEPLIEGVGKGLITGFPGNPNCVIDMIPADEVVNVILAAASQLPTWKDACAEAMPVPIYQCASGDTNPQTLRDIERTWLSYFTSEPMRNASGRIVQGLRPIEYHRDPKEFVHDLQRKYARPLGWVQGALESVPWWKSIPPLRDARNFLAKKTRGLEKTMLLAELYSAYTLNEWIFDTTRTRKMMGALAGEDQERFPFTPHAIDWEQYWMKVHIPGMRRHVLKEDMPASKL